MWPEYDIKKLYLRRRRKYDQLYLRRRPECDQLYLRRRPKYDQLYLRRRPKYDQLYLRRWPEHGNRRRGNSSTPSSKCSGLGQVSAQQINCSLKTRGKAYGQADLFLPTQRAFFYLIRGIATGKI
jgi:hypothetical protein